MQAIKNLRPIDWLIIFVTFISYVPLIIGIYETKGEIQRFSTWIMWTVLDIISLTIALKQRESYAVILAFTIGGIAVTLTLIHLNRVGWGSTENLVLGAVILSMATWVHYGLFKKDWDRATIFATIAQIIAGIPFLVETWTHPDLSTFIPYLGLFTVNYLTLMAAEGWTIKGSFFSGCFLIYNIALLIPLLPKLAH